ncbi:MAG: cytochrome B [endosymbiont of Escarpia spicata]|uniref:Cytochrome B n=1 Tax=endosymbiont of Escarpia spicata TaxID=2200908 RepID=A0A370DRF8_9GAMM|nr:MAG: cytochrome B [endosymbiont of Escarpia spicata]
MMKNTENSYGTVAKSFHWLLFFMLTFSIVAGNFLASMPKGAEKLQAAGMHKSFGVILLLLILARLVWRLINATPKEPEGTPPIQNILAHAMHWALYALMFAQPLSGILMSQAAGYPVSFFGLFELPVLLDKDPSLAQLFRGAHGTVWILLVLAVIGHAGAALHHRLIKKDDVLKRMGFGAQA